MQVVMHYTQPKHLLRECIILVTRASSAGIGREAALTYARFGCSVGAIGTNREQITSGSDEDCRNWTIYQAHIVTMDLLHTTPAQRQQVADDLIAQIPRIDACYTMTGY